MNDSSCATSLLASSAQRGAGDRLQGRPAAPGRPGPAARPRRLRSSPIEMSLK